MAMDLPQQTLLQYLEVASPHFVLCPPHHCHARLSFWGRYHLGPPEKKDIIFKIISLIDLILCFQSKQQ